MELSGLKDGHLAFVHSRFAPSPRSRQRRRWLLILTGLALVSAACSTSHSAVSGHGGSARSGHVGSTTSKSASGSVNSNPQIGSGPWVITKADLPASWTGSSSRATVETNSKLFQVVSGVEACLKIGDISLSNPLLSEVFEMKTSGSAPPAGSLPGTTGSSAGGSASSSGVGGSLPVPSLHVVGLQSDTLSAPSAHDAVKVVHALGSTLGAKCLGTSTSTTGEHEALPGTITPVSFPKVGEASAALGLSLSGSAGKSSADSSSVSPLPVDLPSVNGLLALAALGDHVVIVFAEGIGEPAPTTVVATALGKLGR